MELQPMDQGARGADEERPLSVLRADGSADPELDPKLGAERIGELYAAMRRMRIVDERLARLGEQGEAGFVPPCAGREAAIVGATAALQAADWIFPAGGDWGAALLRGMPLADLLHRLLGTARDALKGHEMPAGLSARALRIASASAPAATHLPHAVGLSWAAAQRDEPIVSAAFFEAAEVDAADFHTGLNFAGVMRAPTVFVCRARAEQPGAAEHAVAYGLACARCDGSDLLAVFRTIAQAAERAREERAPTVVDLVIGPEDAALSRAEAHARELGAWDDERERELVARTEEALGEALDAARSAGAPAAASIFSDVYRELEPHLDDQRDQLMNGPRPR